MLFFAVVILSQVTIAQGLNDKDYIKRITSILKEDPDDIQTIAKAGVYFFKKANYKMSAWYLSSPKLYKHKKFSTLKYYYTRSLFNLKSYKSAYFNISYFETIKMSPKIQKSVKILKEKIQKFYAPSEPKAVMALMLYGGSGSVSLPEEKESFQYYGSYLSYKKLQNTYEVSYEKLGMKFNQLFSRNIDYAQSDYTVSLSRFDKSYKHLFKLLYHGNTVNSGFAYRTGSVLFDYSYFYEAYHPFGIAVSKTDFSATSIQDVKSVQYSPRFIFSLFNKMSIILKYNYASTEIDGESTKKYYSSELNMLFNLNKFRFNIGGIAGKEKFLLKSEGFSIQNGTDIITSNYNIEIGYIINSSTKLAIKYTNSSYENASRNKSFTSSVIGMNLGVNF